MMDSSTKGTEQNEMRYTNINVKAINTWEECQEVSDRIIRDPWNYKDRSCLVMKTGAETRLEQLDLRCNKLLDAVLDGDC